MIIWPKNDPVMLRAKGTSSAFGKLFMTSLLSDPIFGIYVSRTGILTDNSFVRSLMLFAESLTFVYEISS